MDQFQSIPLRMIFLLYNTWIFSAASTTWLLVTIKPSEEKITPDP